MHDEFKAKGIEDLGEGLSGRDGARAPGVARARDRARRRGGRTTQSSPPLAGGANEFIVATDNGIIHQLSSACPAYFIIAPTAGKGATCRAARIARGWR